MSQKELYDSVYKSTKDVRHNETPYVFERRLSSVVRLLGPKKGELYLDVGCGDGRFERLLKGFDVVATEISHEAIRKQKNALGYLVCDGRALPLPSNRFDGVICSEVIEHMPSKSEVKFIVNELVRVCKPGGRIIITTPNENSFVDVLRYFATRKRDWDPLHTSLMSEGKLRRLFEKLPVRIEYFGRYFLSLPLPRYEWALPRKAYKYLYHLGKLFAPVCFGFEIKLVKASGREP